MKNKEQTLNRLNELLSKKITKKSLQEIIQIELPDCYDFKNRFKEAEREFVSIGEAIILKADIDSDVVIEFMVCSKANYYQSLKDDPEEVGEEVGRILSTYTLKEINNLIKEEGSFFSFYSSFEDFILIIGNRKDQ